MASETHAFITGPLWLKLKEDVSLLRAANSTDLFTAAAFHIRRLILTRAGWACHALLPAGRFAPELVLTFKEEFQALIRCDFTVRPGGADAFPAERLSAELESLRGRLAAFETKHRGTAYLAVVFDTAESWFYPDSELWEKQSCFWLPVNCRGFPNHPEWRARFEKLARSPLRKL
ncbi:MAG TPA: hypothetical protein ENN51_00945 [candidate division WOR-3 bacterium]|uniref:Uncharacterized protein n=1 Tax=candidate division WOR-3 bacterium TaxID=2052148 RepID=A0A7V0XE89_UNCW3|nr:hypothetical protein [candidate division WOR-3 bacterium]